MYTFIIIYCEVSSNQRVTTQTSVRIGPSVRGSIDALVKITASGRVLTFALSSWPVVMINALSR